MQITLQYSSESVFVTLTFEVTVFLPLKLCYIYAFTKLCYVLVSYMTYNTNYLFTVKRCFPAAHKNLRKYQVIKLGNVFMSHGSCVF